MSGRRDFSVKPHIRRIVPADNRVAVQLQKYPFASSFPVFRVQSPGLYPLGRQASPLRINPFSELKGDTLSCLAASN
jgi:hypothetical protein